MAPLVGCCTLTFGNTFVRLMVRLRLATVTPRTSTLAVKVFAPTGSGITFKVRFLPVPIVLLEPLRVHLMNSGLNGSRMANSKLGLMLRSRGMLWPSVRPVMLKLGGNMVYTERMSPSLTSRLPMSAQVTPEVTISMVGDPLRLKAVQL